ncbi:hypothetical protein RRG08_023899 [Elysia crispata]|uniref:Acireductone dioxygenase n=1 Tax=Elysia crispata TaxID=231223 RepID=A0AAE1AD29_9GAST|nr:hypothetical protein RRG08_023899 [Elysia crispata]
MVLAWYLNDSVVNPRLPNKTDPPVYVSVQSLREQSGMECLTFDAKTVDENPEFAEMREERRFSYEDTVELSRESLPDYDKMLAKFFTEHLHADDEVRMVLSGTGYFDVRDKNDKWIRVAAEKDDMVIVPAGLYHRFTLDQKNYIKCKRLFAGSPVWTAYNRPEADSHPARKQYLDQMMHSS